MEMDTYYPKYTMGEITWYVGGEPLPDLRHQNTVVTTVAMPPLNARRTNTLRPRPRPSLARHETPTPLPETSTMDWLLSCFLGYLSSNRLEANVPV